VNIDPPTIIRLAEEISTLGAGGHGTANIAGNVV